MSRILFVLIPLLGAATMAVPAAQPAAQNAEDTRLANLFQSYLDQEFQRHPVFATQQGNHDFDDRMDDLAPAARKKDAETARNVLAMLPKEIDFAKLSRAGQIDFDIWKHYLGYQLWQIDN